MKNLLTETDFEMFQNEITALKAHIKDLKTKLGEAAKRSGSFVTKNPEYESIYSQIELSEARLKDYEEFLDSIEIVKVDNLPRDTIGPYCLVTTEDENQQLVTYYLIHPFIPFESPEIVTASPFSPVGKALTGKKVGEIVEVQLPKNKKVLKILKIEIR